MVEDARQFRNLQNNSAMAYKLATFAQHWFEGVRSGDTDGGRIGVVVILIQEMVGVLEDNYKVNMTSVMFVEGGFSSLVRSLRAQCIEFLTEIVARLDFDDEMMPVEVNRNNKNRDCYDEATGVVITKQVSTDWAHFIMRKPVLPSITAIQVDGFQSLEQRVVVEAETVVDSMRHKAMKHYRESKEHEGNAMAYCRSPM
ncbi:hypothetical protein Tco_0814361 [Tanacetum coccineum]